MRVGFDDTFTLTPTSSGTRYFVSNPQVIQVDNAGLVSAIGPGEAVLTMTTGPAEKLIMITVENPHAGPTALGASGGVVQGANGYTVAVAPGALPETATVSITPLTQAQLPMTIPGPFEFAAAFDLAVGDRILGHPLQLAIPVSSAIAPGTKVYFFKEGSVPDATGAERPVWMQMEVGVVGPDGVARTTSYPEHGVDRSGTIVVTTAPTGSIAQVVGTVHVTYTFPPKVESNFLAFASLGGGVAIGAFAALDQSLALITMNLPIIPNIEVQIVEVRPEGLPVVTTTNVQVNPGVPNNFNANIFPAPPAEGLWSPPAITAANLEFTESGAELVITGARFTYTNPGAPAGKTIGRQIQDLEVHFLQPDGLPDVVVHPLASSTDTAIRVVVPQTVTLGLATIQVKRPQYVQGKGDWSELVKKESNVVVPTRPDDRYLYAALRTVNQVAVIEVDTNQLKARVPVGGATSNPQAVTFSPDNTRAYVTLAGDRGIAVVDNVTLQQLDADPSTPALDIIHLPGGTPFGAVVDPHGKYLYVSDLSVGTVHVIDVNPRSATYHQVVKQIGVTALAGGLRGLDINADGTRLYVAAPATVAAVGSKSVPPGKILVIDTNPTSQTFHQQIGTIDADQDPYAVRASATDPHEIVFTNRRSEPTGINIIHANDSQTAWSVTSIFAHLGPLPAKDNFDLNNPVGVAILKAGTFTNYVMPDGRILNQTKDYAFVTGFNRYIQNAISFDPLLQASLTPEELESLRYDFRQPVGGNVGVIEDPFGTFGAPTLIAATKATELSFPDNLDLTPDGRFLYAGYQSVHAVQRYDVTQILKTIADNRDLTANTITGQGSQPKLSVTPLDDINSLVAAGFIVTGGLPHGLAMDARTAEIELGFGRVGSTAIVPTALAGDTTPFFRWRATYEENPIPSTWTTKLYVSTFKEGDGLFPDDKRDNNDVDLHHNRILNGVTGVHNDAMGPGVFEVNMDLTELVAARVLTLGQTYYMGVQVFEVVNGVEVLKGQDFLKFELKQKPAPDPATATNFSSVTVLTHGFQPELPFKPQTLLEDGRWLLDMADQIIAAGGGNEAIKGSNVLRYDKPTGTWTTRVGTPAVPVAGQPLVLLPDWWTESDVNDSGFSEAAADSFFASLVTLDKTLKVNSTDSIGRLFHSPLHFIGHSRGTVVTSEVLQRLGEYEDRVLSQQPGYSPLDIQFTMLDVHDELNGPQESLKVWGVDWTDFNEPIVKIWQNVDFADNYYQSIGTTSFTPNGREVVGADLNVQLNGLAGFLKDDANFEFDLSHAFIGPHSRVWRWYAGTTDLTTPTFERTIAGNEPIFRSLQDISRFNPSFLGEPIGGGGNLPWYVPQSVVSNYYGQPALHNPAVLDAPWEGTEVGWWYSTLGGGATVRPAANLGARFPVGNENTAPGETVVTPDLTVWSGSAIPTIFNGDFEAGNMQRDLLNPLGSFYRGSSTPGWAFHQDSNIGNIDGFVTQPTKIVPYALSNGSTGHAAELNSDGDRQLVHNRFYVPMEAQFVQFKYFVKEVESGRDQAGNALPRHPDGFGTFYFTHFCCLLLDCHVFV